MTTTPARQHVFDAVTEVNVAERSTFGGKPLDALLKAAQALTQAILQAMDEEPPAQVPPNSPPPPTTAPTGPTGPTGGPETPPHPTPPAAGPTGPSGPTGSLPSTFRPRVLGFTTSGSPSDVTAGKLVYDVLWSEIEAVEGHYDWSKIEAELAPYVTIGKFGAVRIQNVMGDGRQGTPQWLFDQGVAMPDPSLFVPDYFDPTYIAAKTRLWGAFAAWLAGYAHRGQILWLEPGEGIYAETKVDSEQGHTITPAILAKFDRGQGYTDAKWDARVRADFGTAIAALAPLKVPVVANMDRSFVGGDPAYTASRLGGELRAMGAWLGNHGYRQGQAPDPMYTAGPTIWEQYLSATKTGNNAATEVSEMVAYATAHGGYTLVYTSDIPAAAAAIKEANGL